MIPVALTHLITKLHQNARPPTPPKHGTQTRRVKHHTASRQTISVANLRSPTNSTDSSDEEVEGMVRTGLYADGSVAPKSDKRPNPVLTHRSRKQTGERRPQCDA